MNNDFWFLVFVCSVISLAAILGIAAGYKKGTNIACESVNLEWVKDKCMKVTREPV